MLNNDTTSQYRDNEDLLSSLYSIIKRMRDSFRDQPMADISKERVDDLAANLSDVIKRFNGIENIRQESILNIRDYLLEAYRELSVAQRLFNDELEPDVTARLSRRIDSLGKFGNALDEILVTWPNEYKVSDADDVVTPNNIDGQGSSQARSIESAEASDESFNRGVSETPHVQQVNRHTPLILSNAQFSPSSREAIKIAERLCKQIKNPDGAKIFTELLLVGMNEKIGGPTNAMLAAFGIDRDRLLAGLAAMRNWDLPSQLSTAPIPTPHLEVIQLPFSVNATRVLERAGEIAKERNSNQIRTRHILIALLENDQYRAYEWLNSMGIPIDQVRATLLRVSESQTITPAMFAYAAGVASADQTADKDTLGFTPYAQALAEIIIKKETVPPVVFGIYGPWGSGKSTFMSFVRKFLEKWDKEHQPKAKENRLIRWISRVLRLQKRDRITADQAEGIMPRIVCVRFDAWAYTDSAKLWVGLVRTISEKIDSQIRWWQRPFYWIRRGGWKFLGAVLISLLPVLAGVAFVLAAPFWAWVQNQELVSAVISLLGPVVGFLGSVKLFDMQKPLSSIVESQIQRLDKTEIEGVTNRIQDELHKTVRDYFQLAEDQPLTEDKARSEVRRQKKFKLVVLIDELDRCPMEKIVEILESIKLFLAEDIFIVLMAVDARVAAEAIRMHYKDVKNPDLAREYLEKIIQVPIPVPVADRPNLTTYVDSLMTLRIPQPEKKIGEPQTDFPSPRPQLLPARAALLVSEEPFKPFNLEDSLNEQQVLIEFAEKYLDSNPRRIKRLLNTYRYVKILATRRGIRTDTAEWQTKMILWLGTTMRWPVFMEEAIRRAGISPVVESELWDQVRETVGTEYCPPINMLAKFPLKATELKAFCDLADNFIKENPPVLKGKEDRKQEMDFQKSAA